MSCLVLPVMSAVILSNNMPCLVSLSMNCVIYRQWSVLVKNTLPNACCLGWMYINIYFSPKWTGQYNRFSQRIIGSFYIIFFVIWEQSLPSLKKEVQSQPAFSITFLQSGPFVRSRRNTGTHARVCRINKTSKWMFNEHFRSHNGMSLMSCNVLPVDGHASILSLPLRLWQLFDNGLNFAECRLLASTSQRLLLFDHRFGFAVENHEFSIEKIRFRYAAVFKLMLHYFFVCLFY